MPSLVDVDANGCTALTTFLAPSNLQLACLNLTGCAILRRLVVGSPMIQRLSANSCPRLLVSARWCLPAISDQNAGCRGLAWLAMPWHMPKWVSMVVRSHEIHHLSGDSCTFFQFMASLSLLPFQSDRPKRASEIREFISF